MAGKGETESWSDWAVNFLSKWIKVLFYFGLAIARKLTRIPRRKIRDFLKKYETTFEEEDVQGKIVVITGSNAGIGKEVAVEMAKRRATVIMACRNMDSVKKAIVDIRNQTFLGTLVPMHLDLASIKSVQNFASTFGKKFDHIDILVNNGGVLIPEEKNLKTEDGFEINFGVNHLGHFLLTQLLLPFLRKADSARIVTVSSLTLKVGHTNFNFDDPMRIRNEAPPNPCVPVAAYANSKYANALFSYELAKRLKGTKIRTYCLCPGITATDIDGSLNQSPILAKLSFTKHWFFLSPNKAAQTIVYCGLAKECSRQTGEMYRRCKLWESGKNTKLFPDDYLVPGDLPRFRDEDAQQLWKISAKLVKYEENL